MITFFLFKILPSVNTFFSAIPKNKNKNPRLMGHVGWKEAGGLGPLQERRGDAVRCCHGLVPLAGASVFVGFALLG